VHKVILIAVVTGLANSLLLAIINHAADFVANKEITTQYFLMYLCAFMLFLYGQQYSLSTAVSLIEEALSNLRTRLSNKLRKVDLSFYEQKGESILYNRLTNDNALLSQAIPRIIVAAQFITLIIFSLIYMGFISPISFFITLLGLITGYFLFLMEKKKIKKSMQGIINHETEYFESLSHLLNGFKEIKINQLKSQKLYATIVKNADETKELKILAGKIQAKTAGIGRLLVFSLMPILIFIIPIFNHEQTVNIYKITATMLFIYGPITVIFDVIPLFTQINVILKDVYGLEAEIDAAIHQDKFDADISYDNFNEIQMNELLFSYPKQKTAKSFSVGPISGKITAGELLFVIGGNGSGKSTFLKLLVGLYYPKKGSIRVDNDIIDDENYQNYRELFSIIFTDFHLFDQLYGVEEVKDEVVNYWLKKMWMEKITRFKNGRFTSTDLSTGQRKRLAFIAAILEDKPILILDEFAADQDPDFRRYFYEEILLELKEKGKTVIAVTHDDHYFHVADRVLKMDSGQLSTFSVDKNNH
jgi:putative ATP-binding cassette transporter